MQLVSSGWQLAGVFSLLAVIVSFHLIYKHLRNYTSPALQKPIVRILIMVPIYATNSFLSLYFVRLSLWWDLARDCYEAYCIYNFFSLIVTYVAVSSAPQTVEDVLASKPSLSHPFPLCCLPKIRPGRDFLLSCYQCVLQFVFVKPSTSIAALILDGMGLYGEDLTPSKGLLWLTCIDNLSISLSLYYLVLYYLATKKELKPFDPISKFLCIKMVIFFSFWQGVAIAVLAHFHLIRGTDDMDQATEGTYLQDFLICVEMFFLSVAHHYAFPYRKFRDPKKAPFLYDRSSKRLFANPKSNITPLIQNFYNVASISDVITDTKNSFVTPLRSKKRNEDYNEGCEEELVATHTECEIFQPLKLDPDLILEHPMNAEQPKITNKN